MTYQLPAGARDLLPLDVAQKCWIEQRLQQVFHRWSYQRIITPTLERLDALMAGGAVQPETVIQLQDAEEGLLGLRPELTASIARAAVTRMAGATFPLRLYYNANIFRQQSHRSCQQEFFQAGVELLGGETLPADAEVLLLLTDCLTSLGLSGWHLILGEAGLTRSLLSVFPENLREAVRLAISQLDRVTLTELPLTPDLRDRAIQLMNLRGQPADVLQKVAQWQLAPEQQTVINNLKSLVELLSPQQQSRVGFTVTLDLSLIQTFDYYTGIVFEVASSATTGQRVLGQGGRYDQLLGLYHPQGEATPGIGFSLNIEDLHQELLTSDQLPQQTPSSDWLVVPASPAAFVPAFAHAHQLRTNTDQLVRVEMDLRLAAPAQTRDYARQRQIKSIVWIDPDGTTTVEPVVL